MKFGHLLFIALFLASPEAVSAQVSQTTANQGVVEEWSALRNSNDRAALQAFIQRWPAEPLYAALAQRRLDTLPQNAPPAEIAPTPVRTPFALAPPQATTTLERLILPSASAAPARSLQSLPLSPAIAAPNPPRIDLSPPLIAPTQAQAALEFLTFTIELLSLPDNDLGAAINTHYTERVNFYGNDWTRRQVIADKRGFFTRWPVRRYEFIPDKTTIECTDNLCRIEAEMTFYAHSPSREATSSGRAQFSYIVDMRGVPLIQLESSRVLERY